MRFFIFLLLFMPFQVLACNCSNIILQDYEQFSSEFQKWMKVWKEDLSADENGFQEIYFSYLRGKEDAYLQMIKKIDSKNIEN